MSWLKDLKRELQQLGKPLYPRAERRTASGLAARFGLDSASTPAGIKDISATGIYLFTEKRLRTGELITLIILEEEASRRTVPSTSFPFTLGSPGRERTASGYRLFCLRAWIQTSGQCSYGTSSLSPIRIKSRTCSAPCGPSSSCAASVSPRLRKRSFFWAEQLDSDRTETLFNIALDTENLLASEPDADRMRAHPKLVANILREGSWAPDDLTRQLWTGLLVSSCSADAPDDSNQVFVNLLIHVTPVQARILTHACERAIGSAPGAGNLPSGSIVLNAEEMIELTGVHDLTRNATDLAYLFNLGLIQKALRLHLLSSCRKLRYHPLQPGP